MSETKHSLLIVGHTYATAFTRRKLNPLADYFDVTCITWPLEGRTLYGKPLSDFEEDDHYPRYSLIRLPVLPRKSSITRYFQLGLAREFKKKKFDIVLVDSEPWGFIRWQTWLACRLLQPHALFGEFSWENVERPGIKGAILSLAYKLAVKTDGFSISGNSACRNIFLHHGASPETNLVAAQLGVEIEEFKPATQEEKLGFRTDFKLPTDSFLIGFCGRYTEAKGIRELLEAITLLRSSHPSKNIGLAMIGHGEMEKELKKRAQNDSWLHLIPPCTHKEVASFMRSLDLLVLPSKPQLSGRHLWEEQFGHVLIESMASGIPTLGSSSGAIPEVIGFPEAIFLHSDSVQLFRCIDRWVQDDEGRASLAHRQKERTLANYTHEAVARTWGRFLQDRLEHHRSHCSRPSCKG